MGTSQNASDFSDVISSLKNILKIKKVTYKALAKKLRLSESGVKKIFTSEDCSFKRLEEISEAVGVSLGDLLSEVRNPTVRAIEYSVTQQEALMRQKDLFHFFWKLVYERMEVAEIKSEFAMTDLQVFKYLKKLDDLKLIRLHPGNVVKLPRIEPIRWESKGPLAKKIFSEWPNQILKDAQSNVDEYESHLILRYYKLTERSRKELVESLRAIEDEFLKRTIREMKLYRKDLESVRMLCVVAEGNFIRHL